MKERAWLLGAMALAAPLLVALSLGALLLRSGPARLQALPPLLIGSGLLLSRVVGRRRRRRHLLQSLRHVDG